MPGTSDNTMRVSNINGSWTADGSGGDGKFEILVVTDDDARHTIVPSLAAVPALLALINSSTVLLWASDNQTLIAANIVGDWSPQDDSRLKAADTSADRRTQDQSPGVPS